MWEYFQIYMWDTKKYYAEFAYIITQIPQLLTFLNHLRVSCRPDDPLPTIFHYFIQRTFPKFKGSLFIRFA